MTPNPDDTDRDKDKDKDTPALLDLRRVDSMTLNQHTDQPDTGIVAEWEHNGRDCLVKWIALAPGMAYWTGYAQTTLDDSTHTYETLQEAIDVHGGITYGPRKGFVGFDCCHGGDVCIRHEEQSDNDTGTGTGLGRLPIPRDATQEWTLSDVIDETESLADQLDAIESDGDIDTDTDKEPDA